MTTTALAIAPQPQTLASPEASWSPEQTALIKRTVAPDATTDELAMFLHVAAKAGLDPLQKQVWFVKRSGRVSIQAGVDGLQARALRMPDCEGIMSAAVYEKEDFLFDKAKGEVVRHQSNPFGAAGRLVGAWGVVRRAGKAPFVALIRFEEYSDSNSPLWKNKPGVMLEKVARSTALRRAYPEAFGGIYEPAEMGKAALAEAPNEVPANVAAAAEVLDATIVPPPEEHPSAVAAHTASMVSALANPARDEAEEVVTPEEVDALWKRTVADRPNSSQAGEDWKDAAIEVFGRRVPDPKSWKRWQLAKVAIYLFPPSATEDVPF